MSIDQKKYQVIIVGGGPVGLGLAIELGQRDIRVALAEKYKTLQPVPKGQNLTQRTVEHFHFWGVEKEIQAARTMPQDYPIGGVIAYGSLVSNHWYPWLKREMVRPFYYTDNQRLPQYATEAVLRQRVSELPSVDTYWDYPATAISHADDHVSVQLTSREEAQPLNLVGEYLVGCDGSRSIVRSQASISQTMDDHDKRMALIVFRSKELHQILERFPGKSFYNVVNPEQKGYWQFFGRVDVGEQFFFHAPVPIETTKENFDFRALLYRCAGIEFEVDFDYIGFWDLRFAQADTYRNGRIFIAGDACHSHPPYGGYGINTGFEDARNLGWKLAAQLEGWGSDTLLDSYTLERHPIFESTMNDFIKPMIARDREFTERYDPQTDPEAFQAAWDARGQSTRSVTAFEPHYEGSTIVFGPDHGVSSAVGEHQHRARAGHHLSPKLLSNGNSIYSTFGHHFTLLALNAESDLINRFKREAKQLHMPLEVIEESKAESLADYQSRLILIRPDQFVSWCSNQVDLEEIESILSKSIGRSHGN